MGATLSCYLSPHPKKIFHNFRDLYFFKYAPPHKKKKEQLNFFYFFFELIQLLVLPGINVLGNQEVIFKKLNISGAAIYFEVVSPENNFFWGLYEF